MTDKTYLPGFEPLHHTAHYNHDPLGKHLGLEGAGPLAIMTRDQLHPPMVDDEAIWADGNRWYEGAVRHTREAAQLAEIRPGEKVLDIGCGIGGPARTLVDEFGARVHSISTSEGQIKTLQEIVRGESRWAKSITAEIHDCQQPYREKNFDVAWSMNMIYHVPSKPAMLNATYDALRIGGRLMIDDWMLTPRATEEDRDKLEAHFLSRHFLVREDVPELLARHGFTLARFLDLGHVGRLHLQKYFGPVFDQAFRPILIENDPEYGERTSDDFRKAIQFTASMYAEERMTYFRFVAVKA